MYVMTKFIDKTNKSIYRYISLYCFTFCSLFYLLTVMSNLAQSGSDWPLSKNCQGLSGNWKQLDRKCLHPSNYCLGVQQRQLKYTKRQPSRPVL